MSKGMIQRCILGICSVVLGCALGFAGVATSGLDDPPPTGIIVQATVRSVSAITTYVEDGLYIGEQTIIFEGPVCICDPNGGYAHFTIPVPEIRYTGTCGINGKCVMRAPAPPTSNPIILNVYAPVDGNSCIGGAKLKWHWQNPEVSCTINGQCDLPALTAVGFETISQSKTPCTVSGGAGD